MSRTLSGYSAAALLRMNKIEQCLMAQLQTVPYQQVHVSGICQRAGISRVTFYQYYESKEDCLGSAIDHLFQEALLYLNSTVPAAASPLEICTMMLDFWKAKGSFFDVLGPNNLYHIFLERAVRFAAEEDFHLLMPLEFIEKEWDKDILSYYVGGQITFLAQWHFRGCDAPTEEMAKKYLHILQGIRRSTQQGPQQNSIL